MKSTWEGAKVGDEDMRLYVSVPEGAVRFPGVVVIQTQSGVDEFAEEMTRRIASEGYVAVAPDLYHRDDPGCQDDPPTRRGRLRDQTIIKDVNVAVDFLKGHHAVDSDLLGIIGFCMGGRVAYFMAAANAGFKAAVSYYGGNTLVSLGEGKSPFERTSEIHCPIMGHFGEDDGNPSPDDMRKLDAELTKTHKAHEFYSYAETGHGFMNSRSKSHRPKSSEASWPRTLDFFGKNLGKSTARMTAAS